MPKLLTLFSNTREQKEVRILAGLQIEFIMAIVRWTTAEDRYLREIYPKYRNSSIAILMRRSKSAVLNRARKLGLHKGQELLDRIADQTRFKRGIVPPNKGRKRSECYSQDSISRMEATQFKPGNKPLNYKGGSLVSGCFMVYENGKQINLKRKVWEEHNGPILNGYVIVCKDGNPRNCDIENLEMRKRGWNIDRSPEAYAKRAANRRPKRLNQNGKTSRIPRILLDKHYC